MMRKYFVFFLGFLAFLTVQSCQEKHKETKALKVPIRQIKLDSTLVLSEQAKCRVAIAFDYLDGVEHQAINDLILKSGLLQPNYFVNYKQILRPDSAIQTLMDRYLSEYKEIATQLQITEQGYSNLDWELQIKNTILPGKEDHIVCKSEIKVKTGSVVNQYTICRNIDVLNKKIIDLKEAIGNRDSKKIEEEMLDKIAEKEHTTIDKLKEKGYFVDIKPYLSENFILYDDSISFVYPAGTIHQNAVTITMDL